LVVAHGVDRLWPSRLCESEERVSEREREMEIKRVKRKRERVERVERFKRERERDFAVVVTTTATT
jgi:hypothetical protein